MDQSIANRERRVQEEAERQADEIADILRELYQDEERVAGLLKEALVEFHTEDKEAYDAFFKHYQNACRVAGSSVRLFDIVRWWRDLP